MPDPGELLEVEMVLVGSFSLLADGWFSCAKVPECRAFGVGPRLKTSWLVGRSNIRWMVGGVMVA